MARMTKNFFRERIKASRTEAYKLLPTILKRYGIATKVSPRKSIYRLYLDRDDFIEGYNRDTSWWVRGFELDNKGKVYLLVYWQGDSTDGDEYALLPSSIYDSAHIPPSQLVMISGDYYIARNAIYIKPEEIHEAIKNLKI